MRISKEISGLRGVAGGRSSRCSMTGYAEMLTLSNLVLLIVLTVSATGFARATRQSSQSSDQAAVRPGPAVSGEYIFKWYCAACHGKDAKGNGPAASELKVPPPDLTTLAKRNTRVLVKGPKPAAHGTVDMPTWGPLFEELNSKGHVTVEINRVVEYLESIQAK